MDPKPDQDERMARNTHGTQNVFLQKAPFGHQRTDEPSVTFAIHAQCLARLLDGVIQNGHGSVVQGMGERIGWIDSLETVLV